jgi:hypothetical protein
MDHMHQENMMWLNYNFKKSKFGQDLVFRRKVQLIHPEAKRLCY